MNTKIIPPGAEPCDDGGPTLPDIGRAPMRRRPYFFLEQPDLASSPSVTRTRDLRPHPAHSRPALQRHTAEHSLHVLDLRELGPRRDVSTLLRALMLFAIALALMCACAVMTALVATAREATVCVAAMLVAGAGGLLAAEVLAEELEHFFITHGSPLVRARFWWERLRRRLRALAGGTTALSFGPYR